MIDYDKIIYLPLILALKINSKTIRAFIFLPVFVIQVIWFIIMLPIHILRCFDGFVNWD